MKKHITNLNHEINPASYWIDSTPKTSYPELAKEISVDVAVIGGGIAGITSAFLLKEAGMKVAVIESRRIIEGVTGHTTAKITCLHMLIYSYLINKFGKRKAQLYADANMSAIKKIQEIVKKKKIECDLVQQQFFIHANSDEMIHRVRDEVKAAKSLGLPAKFVKDIALPVKTKGAIRIDGQAQFHPRKYLLALANEINGNKSYIFENTRALGITEGKQAIIKTDKLDLKAKEVIIATNYPFYDRPGFYFSRIYPIRSYALAAYIKEPFPKGMYISAEEPNFAFRSASSDKGNLVIASGESHKPGQEPNTIQRYYNIEDHTRKTFTVRSIPYMWSTQDTVTIDKVPYIGKITSDSKNIYVATGFGEWGMTTGTLSGMLLSDLILKKENRWESLFDPARFKSGSGLKELIKQNINVAGELIKGKLPKETSSPGLFAANEARVVKVGANTIAAYHDKDGKVYALDPVCTHMGCTVAWNNAEKSWDCPCHGSRFSYTGEVLHGPTVKDLPKKESQENISALKTLFKHLKR